MHEGEETLVLSLYNLMILLYHVHKGAKTKDVGFEDANHSIRSLTKVLNHEVVVKKSEVESALWSCNLMAEQDLFWHPMGYDFDYFAKVALKGKEFNKKYNWINS